MTVPGGRRGPWVSGAVSVGSATGAVLAWSWSVRRVEVDSPVGPGRVVRSMYDEWLFLLAVVLAAVALVAVVLGLLDAGPRSRPDDCADQRPDADGRMVAEQGSSGGVDIPHV